VSRSETLAALMAQASEEGAQPLTLRAMIEETTELATERALDRLGLGDRNAENDLDELRELLQAWRDAKASVWKAFLEWAVRGVLAALLIGIAVRLGVWELL
jgi:hypothetical protein